MKQKSKQCFDADSVLVAFAAAVGAGAVTVIIGLPVCWDVGTMDVLSANTLTVLVISDIAAVDTLRDVRVGL